MNETWIFAAAVYLPQTNFITSGKMFAFFAVSLFSYITGVLRERVYNLFLLKNFYILPFF